MALPAALFTQAAPYAAWEFWVHLLSGAAVALAAAATVVWVVRFVWPAAAPAGGRAARLLLGAALATAAAALWVVGTPPTLVVLPQALATDLAANLAQTAAAGATDPTVRVTAPAWAGTAAAQVLADYGNYALGRYEPPTPAGYHLALVLATPPSDLSGLVAHGDSAPVPNLAKEVVGVFASEVPVSTVSQLAAMGGGAVGAVTGTAVTRDRHIAVILVVVFVADHG